MTSHVLDRIQRLQPEMSRAEAEVADWVLTYPQRAVGASIAEVANTVAVSEPTVIRFCRRVGASGFRELKAWLIAALNRPESYLHQDVLRSDSAAEAVAKVLDNEVRALVDLRGQAARLPFEAAADRLARSRQILFVGLGASGLVAADACHKFFRLGLPCASAGDEQTVLQRAAVLHPDDLFFAVSHSGSNPCLLEAMALAETRGATRVALTEPGSPLAKAVELVFACHVPENTGVYTPMSSRLAHLAVLDALQVVLALRLGDAGAERLANAKAALDRLHSPEPAPLAR